LTTTTIFGLKLSCKQAKRPDGSLFFDCGHNVPKGDLKVRNSIIIWRTVTPEPPEHAYLPPHPDNFKQPINLVKVDEPNYPNVSYNILTPFLIEPILPVTLNPSKPSVNSPSGSEYASPSAIISSTTISEKTSPKHSNQEKRTEINYPDPGAVINQKEHLESSHAMHRVEAANLISVSSEIDQQTSGQQFPWTGCATSIWIFYLYFFLFILM